MTAMVITQQPAPSVLPLRAARLALGVSERTMRRYVRAGVLRAFRLPTGVWRIPASEIERLRTGAGEHR